MLHCLGDDIYVLYRCIFHQIFSIYGWLHVEMWSLQVWGTTIYSKPTQLASQILADIISGSQYSFSLNCGLGTSSHKWSGQPPLINRPLVQRTQATSLPDPTPSVPHNIHQEALLLLPGNFSSAAEKKLLMPDICRKCINST